MLVLDNCEHVIATAASMAEAPCCMLTRAARVLATSREPLRAEGECLYRVPPLAVPARRHRRHWTTAAARRGSTFCCESASARTRTSHRIWDVASAVAGICRRLDGIPLAIELAAARGGAVRIPEISGTAR